MGPAAERDAASGYTAGSRLRRAWADLSLRTTLLLFALGLVTVPGAIFAFFAFVATRAALEHEIGIELRQSAERGAAAVGTALEQARGETRAWARQDVMRDLTVGDVDKRVSRFLQAVSGQGSPYVAILVGDERGTVVAASSGSLVGGNLGALAAPIGAGDDWIAGPLRAAALARQVVTVAVPIDSPDPPLRRIGTLVLLYDWDVVLASLDAVRLQLQGEGKHVAAVVIDRERAIIGGVSFDGHPAQHSALALDGWRDVAHAGRGSGAAVPSHTPLDVLLGAAPVSSPPLGWTVLVIERASDALAAVDRVRTRWTAMLAALLLLGLAAAAWLARQMMRPLREVTRAAGALAAHPDRPARPLPVRSRNEVGQLAASFNQMTVALRRSREQALSAAKFAFAGELAAMVAHEVRTPLTVMRSSAQLLADPAAPVEQQRELAATIVAEVDRIERVVTELIQLARPLEPRFEPTPLNELLARAADFVAAQARRQGVAVTRQIAETSPAHCDREQIYQVMLNLIVNALQVLPPGGRLTLQTLAAEGGRVGFAVADDGPGLPPEIRDHVFEPFVSGRAEGTGLGLAFVQRVALAHGGRVTLESLEGRGTVFAVWLPMVEAGP